MELLHRLKAQYRHRIEKKYAKVIKRKQLNFNCSQQIVLGVKLIAAALEVPYYVIADHMLQVGSYHILMAIKDEKARQELVEHLVRVHLLGNELTDDGNVLRLGKSSGEQ